MRTLDRAVLSHPLTVAALAAVGAGYLALVDPNQPGHYPTCPFLWATGLWCPGCGGLRALHDLLHGRPADAVSANLLVVLAVPVVLGLWTRWALLRAAVIDPECRLARSIPSWFLWFGLILVLIFWGLRNLSATSGLAP